MGVCQKKVKREPIAWYGLAYFFLSECLRQRKRIGVASVANYFFIPLLMRVSINHFFNYFVCMACLIVCVRACPCAYIYQAQC